MIEFRCLAGVFVFGSLCGFYFGWGGHLGTVAGGGASKCLLGVNFKVILIARILHILGLALGLSGCRVDIMYSGWFFVGGFVLGLVELISWGLRDVLPWV